MVEFWSPKPAIEVRVLVGPQCKGPKLRFGPYAIARPHEDSKDEVGGPLWGDFVGVAELR